MPQAEKLPASILHSNVEFGSSDWRLNVGVGSDVVPMGPPAIVVSGGSVSTANARAAGVWSGFPAGSLARTASVWLPSASAGVV